MTKVSGDIGAWGRVAIAIAAITVVAAVVVLFSFGFVEDGFDRIVNWPIIVGSIVGAMWSCVIAAMALDIRHNRNALAALLAVQAKKDEADAAKKAERDAMAAAMAEIQANNN